MDALAQKPQLKKRAPAQPAQAAQPAQPTKRSKPTQPTQRSKPPSPYPARTHASRGVEAAQAVIAASEVTIAPPPAADAAPKVERLEALLTQSIHELEAAEAQIAADEASKTKAWEERDAVLDEKAKLVEDLAAAEAQIAADEASKTKAWEERDAVLDEKAKLVEDLETLQRRFEGAKVQVAEMEDLAEKETHRAERLQKALDRVEKKLEKDDPAKDLDKLQRRFDRVGGYVVELEEQLGQQTHRAEDLQKDLARAEKKLVKAKTKLAAERAESDERSNACALFADGGDYVPTVVRRSAKDPKPDKPKQRGPGLKVGEAGKTPPISAVYVEGYKEGKEGNVAYDKHQFFKDINVTSKEGLAELILAYKKRGGKGPDKPSAAQLRHQKTDASHQAKMLEQLLHLKNAEWSNADDIQDFFANLTDVKDWSTHKGAQGRKLFLCQKLWPAADFDTVSAARANAGAWNLSGKYVGAANILKYIYTDWVTRGKPVTDPEEVTAQQDACANHHQSTEEEAEEEAEVEEAEESAEEEEEEEEAEAEETQESAEDEEEEEEEEAEEEEAEDEDEDEEAEEVEGEEVKEDSDSDSDWE